MNFTQADGCLDASTTTATTSAAAPQIVTVQPVMTAPSHPSTRPPPSLHNIPNPSNTSHLSQASDDVTMANVSIQPSNAQSMRPLTIAPGPAPISSDAPVTPCKEEAQPVTRVHYTNEVSVINMRFSIETAMILDRCVQCTGVIQRVWLFQSIKKSFVELSDIVISTWRVHGRYMKKKVFTQSLTHRLGTLYFKFHLFSSLSDCWNAVTYQLTPLPRAIVPHLPEGAPRWERSNQTCSMQPLQRRLGVSRKKKSNTHILKIVHLTIADVMFWDTVTLTDTSILPGPSHPIYLFLLYRYNETRLKHHIIDQYRGCRRIPVEARERVRSADSAHHSGQQQASPSPSPQPPPPVQTIPPASTVIATVATTPAESVLLASTQVPTPPTHIPHAITQQSAQLTAVGIKRKHPATKEGFSPKESRPRKTEDSIQSSPTLSIPTELVAAVSERSLPGLRVAIEFSMSSGTLLRATWIAAELISEFRSHVIDVNLIPRSAEHTFNIWIGGKIAWSRGVGQPLPDYDHLRPVVHAKCAGASIWLI